MPNLDDHKQIGDVGQVLQDFKKVGAQFEGSIKLNGTNWKARNKNYPYKAGTIIKTKALEGLIYEVEEI